MPKLQVWIDDECLAILDNISEEEELTHGAIIRALIQRAQMGDLDVEPFKRNAARWTERHQRAIARRTRPALGPNGRPQDWRDE